MHVRNVFTLPSVLAFLVSVSATHRVLAADEKEACLSAADQGQSLRDEGKYTGARDQFVACSRSACPKLVHDQCTDWLRQLDESMPTVVFRVKDDKGNDVTAMHAMADGKPLTGILEGKAVPLDPGPHDIRFERDNPSQAVSVHVVLRAGEKAREVSAAFPALETEPEKPTGEPPAPPPVPAPPEEAPPPPETPVAAPAVGKGRSIASLSLLAAGAVGVGLGVYFGLASQNEARQGDSTAKALGSTGACGPAGTPADPRCKTLSDSRDAQNRDAVLDVVFYAAGGALAASAVATWWLWPKPAGEAKATAAWIAPLVGPNHAGVSLGGTF